jgi:hypothetical protein
VAMESSEANGSQSADAAQALVKETP